MFLYRALHSFFKSKAVEPDVLLKENDVIDGYTVIHTPGHTAGSIALYDPERKIIFVGDAIRNDKGALDESPAHFSHDPKEARRSIEKISKLDFDVMLPGHGEALMPDASDKVRKFLQTLK